MDTVKLAGSMLFLSTLSLRRATAINIQRPSTKNDFYPRSPCGERQDTPSITMPKPDFYPRSPCGERRIHYDNYNLHCVISIHALLAESDSMGGNEEPFRGYFYPRSPCGERPSGTLSDTSDVTISIHALLAESDQAANGLPHAPPKISIHALLAESDRRRGVSCYLDNIISIHALLAESDISIDKIPYQCQIFLSTLSLRRATCVFWTAPNRLLFLSTLSLRRATSALHNILELFPISIHALLAESDFGRAFWPGLSL